LSYLNCITFTNWYTVINFQIHRASPIYRIGTANQFSVDTLYRLDDKIEKASGWFKFNDLTIVLKYK